MGKFGVKKTALGVGDVVSVVFPFSDLKGQKLRPALVVARAEHGDFILCQITSKAYSSKTAIKLTSTDFSSGSLPVVSFIRPDKLFTADTSIMKSKLAVLQMKKKAEVLTMIREMFS